MQEVQSYNENIVLFFRPQKIGGSFFAASVRTCSMWFPVPWCFLAHSLATLGHETVASTTTSIMR